MSNHEKCQIPECQCEWYKTGSGRINLINSQTDNPIGLSVFTPQISENSIVKTEVYNNILAELETYRLKNLELLVEKSRITKEYWSVKNELDELKLRKYYPMFPSFERKNNDNK